MDIFITELSTNQRTQMPMLPERISVQNGAVFQNYSVLGIGEVKIPVGEELRGFLWSGILPGASRANQGFLRINNPPPPASIISEFDKWSRSGSKLRLLVTNTQINHDVYLERYTTNNQGGAGDIHYTINFTLARDLTVRVLKKADTQPAPVTNTQPARPSPPPAKTHTVVKGDSLWAIAQKYMGNGNRYPDLYAANKAVIDPRNIQYNMPRYTIYPGQVLTIP